VFLNRRETRSCRRCGNIVSPRDTALAAVFRPGLLLAAEVALDPRDGDQRPNGGPDEGKGPTQLCTRRQFWNQPISSIQFEITYRESDGLGDGENYGGDGGRTDDRSSAPETIHLEQHSSEVGA
jgi:hypothetical protein